MGVLTSAMIVLEKRHLLLQRKHSNVGFEKNNPAYLGAKYMKALRFVRTVVLLLLSVFLVIPLSANAGIIKNVDLTLAWSSPNLPVTLGGSSVTWAGDYEVKLGSSAYTEAFCVENASGATDGKPHTYTLLSIDSNLSDYFSSVPVTRYYAAAWVAEYYSDYVAQYGDANENYKAGAQLAIWEIMFETSGTFDLSNDSFKTSSTYKTYADEIWSHKPSTFPTYSSEWALAVSPTIKEGEKVSVANFQNYLVHNPVPEPGTMLLLGAGLVGLGLARRKFRKS